MFHNVLKILKRIWLYEWLGTEKIKYMIHNINEYKFKIMLNKLHIVEFNQYKSV